MAVWSNFVTVALGPYGSLGAIDMDPKGNMLCGFSAQAIDPGCGAENVPKEHKQIPIQNIYPDISSMRKGFREWLAHRNSFILVYDIDAPQGDPFSIVYNTHKEDPFARIRRTEIPDNQNHSPGDPDMNYLALCKWYTDPMQTWFTWFNVFDLIKITEGDPKINRAEYVKDLLDSKTQNKHHSTFWNAKVTGLCFLRAYEKIEEKAKSA